MQDEPEGKQLVRLMEEIPENPEEHAMRRWEAISKRLTLVPRNREQVKTKAKNLINKWEKKGQPIPGAYPKKSRQLQSNDRFLEVPLLFLPSTLGYNMLDNIVSE